MSRACPNVQGLACLSQTNTLLIDGLHCCLLYWWSSWGNCGIWELLPPSILPDPWLYLNSFRRSFCCAHDTKCVPVQYGGSVCVPGCHVLPIPPFLTCFLSLLLFTSCSLMETSRAKLKFPWGSQEKQCCIRVRLALRLRRGGAWGFRPLFSGGSEPAAASSTPPCVTDVSEGWCHWSLITNKLAVTVYENPVPLAAEL